MSLPGPTVTGYSTFWEREAPVGQAGAYAMLFARYAPEDRASKMLGRPGMRAVRRIFRTLSGTATGSTATETTVRAAAPAGITEQAAFGGVRTIETVTHVNRATTAADLTSMNAFLDRHINMAPTIANYPADLSGNGGGSKLGR